MADYFTLDPAYEHYEVGEVEIAFRTVFNKGYLSRFSSRNFLINTGMLGFLVVFVVGRQFVRGNLNTGTIAGDIILLSLYAAGFWCVLVTIWRLWEYLKTHNKLRYLRTAGRLREGTLVSIAVNTKPAYWRGDMPKTYYEVEYAFTTADRQNLYGTQIRMLKEIEKIPRNPNQLRIITGMREDESPYWVPSQGTPIRVLYADPETYVML